MPNLWIAALKEYNLHNDSWCLPKKGTPDYDFVKEIMNRMKNPETKKQPPKKTEPKKEESPAGPSKKEPKKKRINMKKEAERLGTTVYHYKGMKERADALGVSVDEYDKLSTPEIIKLEEKSKAASMGLSVAQYRKRQQEIDDAIDERRKRRIIRNAEYARKREREDRLLNKKEESPAGPSKKEPKKETHKKTEPKKEEPKKEEPKTNKYLKAQTLDDLKKLPPPEGMNKTKYEDLIKHIELRNQYLKDYKDTKLSTRQQIRQKKRLFDEINTLIVKGLIQIEDTDINRHIRNEFAFKDLDDIQLINVLVESIGR